MWLGRWTLGTELPIEVQTKNSSAVPTNPTTAPTVNVYKSDGTKILSAKTIPIQDRFGITGLFGLQLFLGPEYAVGLHAAVVSWAVGAFTGQEVLHFEIVSGGHVDGQIIAMTYFQRPHAAFLVYQTDGGKLISGKNPYL